MPDSLSPPTSWPVIKTDQKAPKRDIQVTQGISPALCEFLSAHVKFHKMGKITAFHASFFFMELGINMF